MIKSLVSALLLAAVVAPLHAQNGPSRLEIGLRGSGGSYTCYASDCFEDNARKQRKLEQLASAVQFRCNNATYKNDKLCLEAREEEAAGRQCFANYCSNAVCERRNLTTGTCISGAHFRR